MSAESTSRAPGAPCAVGGGAVDAPGHRWQPRGLAPLRKPSFYLEQWKALRAEQDRLVDETRLTERYVIVAAGLIYGFLFTQFQVAQTGAFGNVLLFHSESPSGVMMERAAETTPGSARSSAPRRS
jgi:hypothetical protein